MLDSVLRLSQMRRYGSDSERLLHTSLENIIEDTECQKALVAKLLGYLLILGSLTIKAPQARA